MGNWLIDLLGSRLWEPHGYCFLWDPTLLAVMVTANLVICLAYYSIPLTLFTLVRKRQDLVHKPIFVLFALFIFGCGTTHLVTVWTLWTPVYWLQGWMDAGTAAVSILTAIVLWPLLPQILALPSPAQLQAANQALQMKIDLLQRTEAALQQRTAELETVNQALAVANQELEAFTSIASHDLKAPLRSIGQLANWITEDVGESLPVQSQTHLSKLRGRVSRMETLLNDLLAYARAGRRRYDPEVVDTGQLVLTIVDLLAPPPGFTVSVAENLPTLVTERVPLETVLRNLLGNAMKHHDRPEVGQVHVTAQMQSTNVEFRVIDNGPGIDPQYHQRIFDPSQTLKPREQVEGSGMGLAIVKKIIESRGGTIGVESTVGNGATFYFTWPQEDTGLARNAPVSDVISKSGIIQDKNLVE